METKQNLWTGALTLQDPEAAGRSFGLLAASSRTDAPGELRIDLPPSLVRAREDGSVTVLLSEAHAAVLRDSVTRTLERIAHLRALHRLGMLNEQAYTSGTVDKDD